MSIDRKALVSRHDPVLTGLDPFSPLSVGNGEFAFSADATGLQSFATIPEGATPLCTMAQWGWHSYALAPGEIRDRERLRLEEFDSEGRSVGYMTASSGQEELFTALRINPHRLNLARLGFAGLLPSGIGAVSQRLSLWEGLLRSEFTYRGEIVKVMTAVHPARDVLSFRVESRGLRSGALTVRLDFPYGSHEIGASDWGAPEKHLTEAMAGRGGALLFRRVLDKDRYFVAVRLGPDTTMERTGAHEFILSSSGEALEAALEFSPGEIADMPPSWGECRSASSQHWARFWEGGGAVELAESADPRAFELERRIVLSRYLTAIQCSGSLPPQETGLTCNSWYGKFHLEMHYWHAAHFVQWGNPELLERSLGWYRSVLDGAQERAASQGYKGARWPKMTDPGGEDSPSAIGPLLCWQQPHPIMYAELLRRSGAGREILELCAELVFETAEFMADYARREARLEAHSDGGDRRYVLGPPLIPAQESHAPQDTLNPTFELEYWRWGLETALAWADESSGHPSRRGAWAVAARRWKAVLAGLAHLPVGSSSGSDAVSDPGARPVYLAHENCPDTFTRFNIDHPSMLLALGMLPGWSVDRATMSSTYDEVLRRWDFETCWGWDFPAMAMTAARLGRPKDAVDILLMDTPKNTWRPNGHNAQGKDARLPLYLPGNGALLLAVGMMAAGWDGSGDKPAPGFPDDGSWKVSVEGIARLP